MSIWRFDIGFLLVTIIFGLFGLPGVSGGATPIARFVFMVVAALFILTVAFELIEARSGAIRRRS